MSGDQTANVRASDPARVARYAEAIEDGLFRMHGLTSSCDHHEEARAVLAVADAELAERDATIAELRAEVERLQADVRVLNLQHDVAVSGWRGMTARAEAAEDALRSLRERIEALADEWERSRDYLRARKGSGNIRVRSMDAREANTWDVAVYALRRAALAAAPAVSSGEAATGEAGGSR